MGGLTRDGQPSKALASFGGSSLQAPGGGRVVKLPCVYEALVTVLDKHPPRLSRAVEDW